MWDSWRPRWPWDCCRRVSRIPASRRSPSSATTPNRSGPSPRPARPRPPTKPTSNCSSAGPDQGDAAVQKQEIDDAAQPGRQGHRRQRHRPQEPDRLPRQDRRQGAAPDRGQRRPRHQALCYIGTDNYEAGKAVGRLVKEAMPDGGTIAIFVGELDRRSTPASAGRASSTSWPARRTSRPTDGADRRQGQQVQALQHLHRPARKAPRRPSRTPSPP